MPLRSSGSGGWPLPLAVGKRFAEVALHAVLGRAHVVRVGQAEVQIEALPVGQELRLVAQVPFADDGRGVAGGLQHFGHGDFLRGQADVAAGKQHVGNRQRALGIAAGHQRRARRRADRRGVERGELAAFRWPCGRGWACG